MITIQFGPYSFGFQCSAENLSKLLSEKFEKHPSSGPPDLVFEVFLNESASLVSVREISIEGLSALYVNGRRFSFVQDIIKGEFSNERDCRLWLKKEAFENYWCSLFDIFLTRCFYHLERRSPSNGLAHAISHASAVERKGRGFLFPAPSETGKTTVASLLDSGIVLQDEAVIVSKRKRGWSIESTPLTGKFPDYQNGRSELNAFFILIQDTKVRVRKVKKFAAYNWLLRQLVLPVTLLDNDKRKGFELNDRLCFDLISSVPCYELSFPKSGGFWEAIEEVVG
jgi:hypothetical protein